MKKIKNLLVLTAAVGIMSCSDDNESVSYYEESIAEVSVESLTQDEIDDLNFIREEEKLARDVYIYSFNLYGQTIFDSISQSEQQHMNQVLAIMELYGLTDSATSEIGVFNNADLQNLYNQLTEQSSISLVEALKVGALIEDLDINDLYGNIDRTDKADIINIYSKLQCGSRNHMRNFYGQLELNSVIYEPVFLSSEELTEIISTTNERCGSLTN